ncbi:glycosyltransferase family 2 protein [Trichothermofontia sp.]
MLSLLTTVIPTVIALLLGGGAIGLLIPITVLLAECLLALLPSQKLQPIPGSVAASSIAILMPAHNESLGIAPTLQALLPQLAPADRLVVIADNCEDDTAAIAEAAGAIVIERQDHDRRGKGYALQHGLQWLATDPPAVVIIVDADCIVAPDGVNQIAQQVMATSRPVQAQYWMAPPPQPSAKDGVSALAFTVKNWVRPLGWHRLGLPCPLTGTGMGFPWAVLQHVPFAGDHLVEDMQLGIDLAIAGYPPQFCPHATVTSTLPRQEQAAKSQRTRWEHGHLQTIRRQVPRLLREALRQGRWDLLALALDLSVPPLSMLVLLWLGAFAVALVAWGLGSPGWPALGLAVEGGMLTIAILIAWLRFAHHHISIRMLLAIPIYILWKIPLYFAFFIRPQSQWVRTERDAPTATGQPSPLGDPPAASPRSRPQ